MHYLLRLLLRVIFFAGALAALVMVVSGQFPLVEQKILQVFDKGGWETIDTQTITNFYPPSRSPDSVVLVERILNPVMRLLEQHTTRLWKYNLKNRTVEKIVIPKNMHSKSINMNIRRIVWNDPTLWVEAVLNGKHVLMSYYEPQWREHEIPFSQAFQDISPSASGVWVTVYGTELKGYGLYHFDGSKWTSYPDIPRDLTGEHGWQPSIFEDYHGKVWLISPKKLMLFDGQAFAEVSLDDQPITGATLGWATDEGNWFVTNHSLVWISRDLSEKKEYLNADLMKRNSGIPLFAISQLSGPIYTHEKSILLHSRDALCSFDGSNIRKLSEPTAKKVHSYFYVTEQGFVLREANSPLAITMQKMDRSDYTLQAASFIAILTFCAMQLIGFALEGASSQKHPSRESLRDKMEATRRDRRAARETADHKLFANGLSILAFLMAAIISLLVTWAFSLYLSHPEDKLRAGATVQNYWMQELWFALMIFACGLIAIWLAYRVIAPILMRIFLPRRPLV
jgi:hypothetical protein